MTLRELRARTGLTQAELAVLAGCDQTAISQIERGRIANPRYRTVVAIARVLKLTPAAVSKAIQASVREAA